jgi:hypothetical protein
MVDYELLAIVEEIRQCDLAVGSVETVLLFDFDVWELAKLFCKSIASFGVLFLFLKKDFPGSHPFITGGTLHRL